MSGARQRVGAWRTASAPKLLRYSRHCPRLPGRPEQVSGLAAQSPQTTHARRTCIRNRPKQPTPTEGFAFATDPPKSQNGGRFSTGSLCNQKGLVHAPTRRPSGLPGHRRHPAVGVPLLQQLHQPRLRAAGGLGTPCAPCHQEVKRGGVQEGEGEGKKKHA